MHIVCCLYFLKKFSVQFNLKYWNNFVQDHCFNYMTLDYKAYAQFCYWLATQQFTYLPILGTIRMPNMH